MQFRKADQPDGLAMGTLYSRGLIYMLFGRRNVHIVGPCFLNFQVK